MPTKKVGSTGRLGARYGAKLRRRVLDIEVKQNAPHRCPACSTKSLKREAAGLWRCRKCNTLFAGGAYVPYTEPGKAARRAIEQHLKGDLITIRDRELETDLTTFLPNPEKDVIVATDAEPEGEDAPSEDE